MKAVLPRAHAARPAAVVLYGAIVAMVAFWALNFIVGKYALREFPAALLAALRVTLALAILLPIYAWLRRPGPPATPKPAAAMYVLLGLTGVTLNQLLFILGLDRTSVAHSSILTGLGPLFVLAIAAARRQEPLTGVRLAGMLLALCGVVVLNLSPSRGGHASTAGDALIILNSLCFAIFTVAGKHVSAGVDTLTFTTRAYLAGAAIFAPLTIGCSLRFDYASVSLAGWAGLLYMAAFPSVVCYLIYYWALRWIPASRVSSFQYLQPLMATLLAVPLLHEPLTAWLGIGGTLVLAGVFLTGRPR